jgi:hypothetical protein
MCTAAGDNTDVVDLYNSGTKSWSTAKLSFPRSQLAAASVGTVAVFAGGFLECASM